MILSLIERSGLPDFPHFSPGPQAAGSFPPSSAQFDKRQSLNLSLPTMG
jgi:hypothetical protein